MDAFFASVEQRDFPEYRGKPLVVGGSPEGRGGVVATASYEARKYGIHSAMSSKTAQRLCPTALFVFPRFDIYKAVSRQIHAIFHRYTDIIEPLSLDEAYLDVTEDKQGIGYALDIARAIKQSIKDELELTASAGVSVNKFVAKIASGMQKPDGLTFIGPSKITAFMEQLPVEKFFGVGRVTAAKMKQMGLHKGADLKKMTEADLIRHFGKPGKFYYQIVHGVDERPVEPDRETKSISVEDTYQEDITTKAGMLRELETLTEKLEERLVRARLKGRTVTVKFKFHDFTISTRSHSLVTSFNDRSRLLDTVRLILDKTDLVDRKVRLLGVGLSNFDSSDEETGTEPRSNQLRLF